MYVWFKLYAVLNVDKRMTSPLSPDKHHLPPQPLPILSTLSNIDYPCRDQRLYKAQLSSKTCDIQPLTAEDNKLRFADAVVDQQRNRLIAVCEDHSKEGEAVNTISSVGNITSELHSVSHQQIVSKCDMLQL